MVGIDNTVDPAIVAAMTDPEVQESHRRHARAGRRHRRVRPPGPDRRDPASSCPPPTAPSGSRSGRRPRRARPGKRSTVPSSIVTGGDGLRAVRRRRSRSSNPYTFRATAIANVTGLLAAIALFALGLSVLVSAALARRFTTPAAPADRRRAAPWPRATWPGACRSRQVRAGLVGARPSWRSSSTRWPTGSRRASRSSAATATGAATSSPTSRTSCGRRWPRCGRSTTCSRSAPATTPTPRAEFLESSGQQIERLDWLAQNLLELSKLDSGPRPARPATGRPPRRGRDRRRAEHGGGPQARRRAATSSCPTRPSGSATTRSGSARSSRTSSATRSSSRRAAARSTSIVAATAGRRADRGRRHRRRASTRPSCPHIFERFYRGSRANEARGSGSGLGLAIVRSIVDMHGGTIVVESRVGEGSRFTVELPRDPRLVAGTPAAERADVASAAAAQPSRTGRAT